MKVKHLQQQLQQFEADQEVRIAIDSKGNKLKDIDQVAELFDGDGSPVIFPL